MPNTYVIGDIHGCLYTLESLLTKLKIKSEDSVICIGDLVGKGRYPWEVLSAVQAIKATIILGNHDLHFIATQSHNPQLTSLQAVALNYLMQAKIAHWHQATDTIMVHAGVWPGWSMHEILAYAEEVQERVNTLKKAKLLKDTMYSQNDLRFTKHLEGWARIRTLINIFTRMRTLTEHKALDLTYTGTLKDMPANLKPWYEKIALPAKRIVFGHWAALSGHSGHEYCINIDGGCVWGGHLQAFCLETGKVIQVPLNKNDIDH